MSTSTHKGLANLREVLTLIEQVNPAKLFEQDTVRDIREAMDTAAVGTMRQWFVANDGKRVTTIQCESTDNPGRWMPIKRTIDASAATYVLLNGSRRDYSNMRVLHATSRVLIVADDWHTIAYRIED